MSNLSTLRIRNDGKVKQMNISKDKLEALQKVVSSNLMDRQKRSEIRKVTGGSPCCLCDGIPSLEVVYDVDGVSRLERYISSCAKYFLAMPSSNSSTWKRKQ